MFDVLKKKFSSFIGSITKKEKEENSIQDTEPKTDQKQDVRDEKREEQATDQSKLMGHSHTAELIKGYDYGQSERANTEKIAGHHETETLTKKDETKKEHGPDLERGERAVALEEPKPRQEQSHKISLETKIKGFIFGTIEIKEKDVEDILEGFRYALLEADVNYGVADRIVDTLRKRLVGSKVDSKHLEHGIRSIIRGSISEILGANSNIDIVKMARAKKESASEPFTVLFVGPNGAGKTTTMGKIANMMLENSLTCVLSASDTFRAAAIEQTAIHAKRLGINVIKGTYGADPASIAFDAVAYAKAHGIDVVLVDSAGRQETNRNLVEEMKKMVRVAKPDIKIFVGESIAGNALIDQIKTFDQAIKLDGVILTKLDCDAKGGNTISVLSETTIPVLYFGIGEAYSSLIPYDQKLILDNVVPL